MVSSYAGTEIHEKNRQRELDDSEVHAVGISAPCDSLDDCRVSDYGSKAETPAGSSSSVAATTNLIATGDINEFTMYQKFRLKIVEMFGSVSSALYEFGADPETGQISRDKFEDVCTSLNILGPQQANLLFSHVTNADPMDMGVGGFACGRHFSVSASEWSHMVEMKRKEKEGNGGNIPFASGPFGRSMGIYHRPMQVDNFAGTTGDFSSIADADQSGSGGLNESKMSLTRSGSQKQTRSSPSRRSQKPYAWRQKQKPWAPSLFAGEKANVDAAQLIARVEAQRGRPSEFTFKTAGRATFVTDQPKYAQLGPSPRRTKRDVGILTSRCPPRREEMDPSECVTQVDAWWPYSGRAPPRKLPITLPRCRFAEAQLSARA